MVSKIENLPETYARIKESIVAIVSRLSPRPEFPTIIGTGFVARKDGLIFTCDHVIDAIGKLPKAKGQSPDIWPAQVFLFRNIPERGMVIVPMDIMGVFKIGAFDPHGYYYGQNIPDMGIIHVNFSGLPAMEISAESDLMEGDVVGASGFPLGTETIMAPGWVHQISPSLQSGIISAVLPFPCKTPHAFLINMMCKPGSSGSPVFDPQTGKVHGMVYANINERKMIIGKDGVLSYFNPTTLTLAIPNKFMMDLLKDIDKTPGYSVPKSDELRDLDKTISEGLEKGEYNFVKPKEPHLTEKVEIETK